MSELLVTGYASLDYPVKLDGLVEADKTSYIRHRDTSAWPRMGGSPYYVACAAKAGGLSAKPISWIGDDAPGQAYIDGWQGFKIDTDGIRVIKKARSPVCLMVHQADDSTLCLYDPGFSGKETLDARQKELIANGKHICITVGPGHLLDEILSLVQADACLYWVMKNDTAAFPAVPLADLCGRVSVVFCNSSERASLPVDINKNCIVVETRGAAGCELTVAGTRTWMPTTSIDVDDPTGAGDTFAGGFLSAFINGHDPQQAAQTGLQSAQALLRQRQQRSATL